MNANALLAIETPVDPGPTDLKQSKKVESGLVIELNATLPKRGVKSVKRHVGRELSRMEPKIRLVHFALEEYFEWKAGGMRLLGVSSRTIIGRLMEEGPWGASQPGGSIVPEETPPKHKDIGDALCSLTDIRKTAIVLTYTQNIPVETIAHRMNQSASRTRNVVSEARQLIASFLAGRGWRFDIV